MLTVEGARKLEDAVKAIQASIDLTNSSLPILDENMRIGAQETQATLIDLNGAIKEVLRLSGSVHRIEGFMTGMAEMLKLRIDSIDSDLEGIRKGLPKKREKVQNKIRTSSPRPAAGPDEAQ